MVDLLRAEHGYLVDDEHLGGAPEISTPLPSVPMVARVNRYAIEAAADHSAGLLQALLVSVVAPLAQCLVVLWIPEQFMVALVRDDVIDHVGGYRLSLLLVHHAEGMLAEVTLSVLLPPPAVATLGG